MLGHRISVNKHIKGLWGSFQMIVSDGCEKVQLGVLDAYKLEIGNKVMFFVASTGGYSIGNSYGKGNFSLNGADSRESVMKNFAEISNNCNIDSFFTVRQYHTNKVLSITPNMSWEESREIVSDGIYIDLKNKGVGITTADCYPVFLLGEKSLTVLHCGWKCTFQGIIEVGIQRVLDEGDKVIEAVIGPGICGDCYEFGLKDLFAISEKYDVDGKYDISKVIKHQPNGDINDSVDKKVRFDLKQLIKNIFIENNIKKVYDIGVCTYETDEFYSHRRLREQGGRFLSFGFIN